MRETAFGESRGFKSFRRPKWSKSTRKSSGMRFGPAPLMISSCPSDLSGKLPAWNEDNSVAPPSRICSAFAEVHDDAQYASLLKSCFTKMHEHDNSAHLSKLYMLLPFGARDFGVFKKQHVRALKKPKTCAKGCNHCSHPTSEGVARANQHKGSSRSTEGPPEWTRKPAPTTLTSFSAQKERPPLQGATRMWRSIVQEEFD